MWMHANLDTLENGSEADSWHRSKLHPLMGQARMVIKCMSQKDGCRRVDENAYLVLSPFSIGSICICVSCTVVQPGQISEGVRIQLRLRNAQLMTQLPHCCTLHTHDLVMLLCSGMLAMQLSKSSSTEASVAWHAQEEGCGAKDVEKDL